MSQENTKKGVVEIKDDVRRGFGGTDRSNWYLCYTVSRIVSNAADMHYFSLDFNINVKRH